MPLYPPAGSGSGAPTDAVYIVGAAHADLSAERVVTDTTHLVWDLATAAQAKVNPLNLVKVLDRVGSLVYNTDNAEHTIYTFDVPANTLGTLGGLRFTMFWDILSNSGTNTHIWKVKLGATTLWADTGVGLANSATVRTGAFGFVLANQSATNVQRAGVWFKLNNIANAATTGLGDIGAIALMSNPMSGQAAEDTTAILTLAVTLQFSVSNSAVEFRRQWAALELV